jgi:hypothetical protein
VSLRDVMPPGVLLLPTASTPGRLGLESARDECPLGSEKMEREGRAECRFPAGALLQSAPDQSRASGSS